MPGAFNGTASSTTSQMEKMLTVFSPLYEKCFPRRWDISGWYRDDRECRTLRGVVGRKSSAKVQFSAATFECAKLSGPGRTVSGSKQNPSFSKLRVAALVINSADPLFGSQPPAKRPSTSPRGLRGRSWLRAKPPTPVSPSHRPLFQDFQHRVEAQNVRVNSEPGNHSFGHIGQDAVDVALGNTADVHLHVW